MKIMGGIAKVAGYLELPEQPTIQQVEEYYHHAMTDNAMMKLFLKKSNNYTPEAQAKLKQGAMNSVERVKKNPYTWCYSYEPERVLC